MQLPQFADDWIAYWKIASDPAKNTRAFRKAVETGEHPLSYVLEQEARFLKQPEMAWQLILELVARADSDMLLSLIGAGPLETMLHRYPGQWTAKIEEQARKDGRFKQCHSYVW